MMSPSTKQDGARRLRQQASTFHVQAEPLVLRILPDPVAVAKVDRAIFAQRSGSVLVLLIPPHGVKEELAIRGAFVFVRFAGQSVRRHFGEKRRRELAEVRWEFSPSKPVSFQSAGQHRLIVDALRDAEQPNAPIHLRLGQSKGDSMPEQGSNPPLRVPVALSHCLPAVCLNWAWPDSLCARLKPGSYKSVKHLAKVDLLPT